MMGLPEEQVQWRERRGGFGWRGEGSTIFQSFYLFAKQRRHHSIFFGNLLDRFSIETDRLSKFVKR